MANATTQMLKENHLDGYFNKGTRWYNQWLGTPWTQPRLCNELTPWFEYELRGRSRRSLTVAEAGPNGGMWTYHLLQMMRGLGVSNHLSYTLFGTTAEHNLARRDALQLFNRWIIYNETHRVRTYDRGSVPHERSPNLISEVKFIASAQEDFWQENTRFNMIVSFDTIEHLSLRNCSNTLDAMMRRLEPNGTLIINIPCDHYLGSKYFKDRGMLCTGLYHDLAHDIHYCRFTH